MGKFLVRITVVGVAIYFIISFIVAQIFGVHFFSNLYIVLFELITVVYCYSENKYHCEFIKHTALSIFIVDLISRLDHIFDFINATAHNAICIVVLMAGMTISLTKAIKHFHKVNKLKKQRNEYQRTIAHKENGISSSQYSKRTNNQ